MDSVDGAPAPQDDVGTPPQRDGNARRYMLVLAAVTAGLLVASIALCVLVDPYAVLGMPRIAGLTRDKPAAADWPRLTKAYTVQHADPVTLIVGNSSADVGFNPHSASWPPSARPVFNLAVDGGLPSTHLRYLQHALSVCHPAHVVIALNFIESLVMHAGPVSAASDSQFAFASRMRVLADGRPNPGYAKGHLDDLVFATLSFTALSDSIRTILHQNDPAETYETALGWNDGGKFRRWAREDGFNQLVVRKDRENIPQLAGWRRHKVLDLDAVGAMVRAARAHGADVTVAILPNHADEMEAVRLLGLDADYDGWKTAVVRAVTQASPGGGAAIWDFSGYGRFTTEPVPAPGDRTHRLRWFWEPVHFQAELGDLMIARMEGAAAPADLGVRLTPAGMPARIAAFHAAQADWDADHPADIARVLAVVRGQ